MSQARQTIQKQTIYSYLKSVRTHPTAEEVYKAVRKKVPTISFATVYRNLKQMSEQGKIKELCFDRQCMRYDAEIKDHQHLICVKCGRVEDHYGTYPAIRKGLSKNGKYKIIDIDISVRAICPKCRKIK